MKVLSETRVVKQKEILTKVWLNKVINADNNINSSSNNKLIVIEGFKVEVIIWPVSAVVVTNDLIANKGFSTVYANLILNFWI